jgi:hypothetical protein
MGVSMREWIGVLCLATAVVAGFTAAARAGEPMFVPWLVADDPGDQVIRDYYERAERGELEAPALVDLGTMLFYRGFPKDAIRYYRRALDIDKEYYEAWFLIGLVEHSRGELRDAEQAYARCLKKRPGHGWANFYYGLLEEQLGHTRKALDHYERSFKSAPELADPTVNPEVLSSELVLGAQLRTIDHTSFSSRLPIRYMEPDKVEQAFAGLPAEPEAAAEGMAEAGGSEVPAAESAPAEVAAPAPIAQPTPTPPPVRTAPAPRRVPTRAPATPPPARGAEELQGETPYGSPPVPQTSDEAHLLPSSDGLWRAATAII